MNKMRLPIYKFYRVFLSLLMIDLILSLFSLPSTAYEVYGPEIRYGSCAQLQGGINNYNRNRGRTYKGFEKAGLMRRSYAEYTYMVYCNGGIIVNREKGTICRGYIGYSYSRLEGTATYYGSWGWTDGSPNDADSGRERYCRKLK
jgi:hypothetical protein